MGLRSVIGAMALLAIAAGDANAADTLQAAVGQCGNWDSSPVQLGDGAGIYAERNIAVEAVCAQGTGETQHAVISGSADTGIGAGTLGALGAFAEGAPSRNTNPAAQDAACDRLLVRQRRLAAQDRQRCDRLRHHRLFEQRCVGSQRRARPRA